MNRRDLEEAVRVAEDTERQAAEEYRREIGESGAEGGNDPGLSPKGAVWVIAYDELAAARDALEAASRPPESL
jgi:hypothetical protein